MELSVLGCDMITEDMDPTLCLFPGTACMTLTAITEIGQESAIEHELYLNTVLLAGLQSI